MMVAQKQIGLRYALILLILLLSLGAPLSSISRTTGSNTEGTAPFSYSRKGIVAGPQFFSGSALTAQVNDMKNLGVAWMRMDFPWAGLQPNGRATALVNTNGHDKAVQALSSRGINVLGLIDYSAGWANGGEDQMVPPTNPSDYGNYARALAEHFGPMGVHAWEIWNEPNIHNFWSTGADPARYTKLLKAAYAAIKQADPQAVVLSAGLAPTADGNGDLSPQTFLKGVYDAGGGGSFDAVADHPYTSPYMPDATNGGAYWWNAMQDLRTVMAQHGDSNKKIWITEYGVPTNDPSGRYAVSQSTQAATLTKAYSIAEQYTWAGPLFWYNYQDGGNPGDSYGVLRHDGTRKQAYSAYKSVPDR